MSKTALIIIIVVACIASLCIGMLIGVGIGAMTSRHKTRRVSGGWEVDKHVPLFKFVHTTDEKLAYRDGTHLAGEVEWLLNEYKEVNQLFVPAKNMPSLEIIHLDLPDGIFDIFDLCKVVNVSDTTKNDVESLYNWAKDLHDINMMGPTYRGEIIYPDPHQLIANLYGIINRIKSWVPPA